MSTVTGQLSIPDQFLMKMGMFLIALHGAPDDIYAEMKNKLEKGSSDTKEEANTFLNSFCKGFINSPDYKSGDTKKAGYKMCCELVDHCSLLKQPWIYMAGAAAVGLLIYIISMAIVGICLCLSKKKSGGGAPPKTPKTGKSTGKTAKSNKKK